MLMLTAHAYADTVNPPFYVQPASAYAMGASGQQSSHRLRIVLNSDDGETANQVALGSVTVCSKTACFRPETAHQYDVLDTSLGRATMVADFIFPDTAVDAIYFDSGAADRSIGGKIALSEPLQLKSDYSGSEVMVLVRKTSAASRTKFVPTGVATNLLRDTGVSVYYSPKFATQASLAFGTSLSIPAAATAGPQIFNVAQHDTGEDFPLVDIYPAVQLSSSFTIKANRLEHKVAPMISGSGQLSPTPAPKPAKSSNLMQASSDATPEAEATSTSARTGVVRFGVNSKGGALRQSNVLATPNAWANCVADLSYPANQQIITNGLAATGTEYINWCIPLAPYVHIGITNILDSRERFSLPHVFNGRAELPQYARLNLQPITYWGPHTQMLINGFVWEGDSGTSDGQTGFADGYEYDAGWFGDNRVGGGATSWQGVDTPGGNKIVMGFNDTNKTIQWGESSVVEVVPISVHHMVSSSTSIMKNGVCGNDSLTNRWSALGTTPTGRIIFISSTSDGQTSAAELCSVFKALGANYALRLDGGPSAAMTIDGKLLNPITGLASFKYGSMRHIAYPLKIAYQGW